MKNYILYIYFIKHSAVFVLFVYWGIFMNILYPYEENNDIMIKTQNMKNRK